MVVRVSNNGADLHLLTREGSGRIKPPLFTSCVQPKDKK